MCRAVSCRVCGRTTWAGCGQHVDQVMKGVPREDRCLGRHTEAEIAAAQSGSLLTRLFGRR